MACIHYKFHSQVDYKTLIFEGASIGGFGYIGNWNFTVSGIHITAGDLKREIREREKIGPEFDLRLTNAQNKKEYASDAETVIRNTSISVARVPALGQGRLPKIQSVV
jgi:E3 ubiquitin-protein ligase RBBP6